MKNTNNNLFKTTTENGTYISMEYITMNYKIGSARDIWRMSKYYDIEVLVHEKNGGFRKDNILELFKKSGHVSPKSKNI